MKFSTLLITLTSLAVIGLIGYITVIQLNKNMNTSSQEPLLTKANNYFMFAKSGHMFRHDIKVKINGGEIKTYPFREYKELKEKNPKTFQLNFDTPNIIEFMPIEPSDDLFEGDQLFPDFFPLVLFIYGDQKWDFSIVGAYRKGDWGKTFSLTLPPLSQIRKYQFFTFKNFPTQKALIVTTSFTNSDLTVQNYAMGSGPVDEVWLRFLEEEDLPNVSLTFDLRNMESRMDEYGENSTLPFFAYIDKEKGDIYKKILTKKELKKVDRLSIIFKKDGYEIREKIHITDRQKIAQAEDAMWKAIEAIQKVSAEVGQAQTEDSEMAEAIFEKLHIYFEKTGEKNSTAFMLFLMQVSSIQDLKSEQKNDYRIEVTQEGPILKGSLYKKDASLEYGGPHPEISLPLEIQNGIIVPVPFPDIP